MTMQPSLQWWRHFCRCFCWVKNIYLTPKTTSQHITNMTGQKYIREEPIFRSWQTTSNPNKMLHRVPSLCNIEIHQQCASYVRGISLVLSPMRKRSVFLWLHASVKSQWEKKITWPRQINQNVCVYMRLVVFWANVLWKEIWAVCEMSEHYQPFFIMSLWWLIMNCVGICALECVSVLIYRLRIWTHTHHKI